MSILEKHSSAFSKDHKSYFKRAKGITELPMAEAPMMTTSVDRGENAKGVTA